METDYQLRATNSSLNRVQPNQSESCLHAPFPSSSSLLLRLPQPALRARGVELRRRRIRTCTLQLVVPAKLFDPGAANDAGLYFKLEPGWHIYWKNAGDSGEPPHIKWTLPEGITASALEFPAPKRLPLGPLMDFGYENEVLFPLLQCCRFGQARPGAFSMPRSIGSSAAKFAFPARPNWRSRAKLQRRARPLHRASLIPASLSAWSNSLPKPLLKRKANLSADPHRLPPRRRHRPTRDRSRILSRRSGHPRQSRAAEAHAHGQRPDSRSQERRESHCESRAIERRAGAFRRARLRNAALPGARGRSPRRRSLASVLSRALRGFRAFSAGCSST